ncbi:Protein BNI4 [Cytospora mali]|uniref:Protein BNI4 n=1 Tax=Cytospora mali TaxID=578113 RepID=A0A194VN54_CYTMA|nr:Protein BNI4 [Valsa mali]
MAALVQSFPQQSGTVTMLQTRNGSASSMVPPQAQPSQQYGSSQQQQRNSYHGMAAGVAGPVAYRGTSAAPIQPYTFNSTQNLNPNGQWQQYPTYNRASSSSAVPTMQSFEPSGYGRPRHHQNSSLPNLSNSVMTAASGGSRDDFALPPPGARRGSPGPRPQPAYYSSSTAPLSFGPTPPSKNQPDRYRRPAQRTDSGISAQGSAGPSGSGMASVSHLYQPQPSPTKERRPSASSRPTSFYAKVPGSVDDMQLYRHQDSTRVRRRSMPVLEGADLPRSLAPLDFKRSEEPSLGQSTPKGTTDKDQAKSARVVAISSPVAKSGLGDGSSESLVSSRSSSSRPSSSANRNNVPNPTGNPAQLSNSSDQNPDHLKLINIPPRSSSTDAAKRVGNPSPLSKPVTMDSGESSRPAPAATRPESRPATEPPTSSSSTLESPAAKQLAAINQKGGKLKSKTSRLRRALSFGSAAEFKKAGAMEGGKVNGEPSTRLQNGQPVDELDAEQIKIAEQQEAAGIGSNIYAGSRLFQGSNDNLSISSTASSASIMIRKMGRGMKKSGRSLAGLFRPKSIIGVPTVETPEGSQATVSMVTVEAERERVNVNAEPNPQNGGGTGFPRLERNSLDISNVANGTDVERAGSSGTDNSSSRRSIVGGDKERAEVLATMRKGILKHTNSNSTTPSPRAVERGPPFDLPAVPHVTDSPNSSAPSTPNDEATPKRNGSVTIGNEDYFMTALRLRQDTKSAPGTPQGTKRNTTFSPRIVFHDTWPSQEYDRRSEIATCNRLTPMLAQQIKEELNNFKMEMEVHESSKIYTHFF